MGSGLILLLIVGAWLAVLVPMALRSQDAVAVRSAERLGDAVRVLRRRSARRVARARAAAAGTGPEPAVRRRVPRLAPVEPMLRALRRPRRVRTTAERRRRTLLTLLGVSLAVLVGGLVSVWLLGLGVLLLAVTAGYVVHLRRLVVRRQDELWQQEQERWRDEVRQHALWEQEQEQAVEARYDGPQAGRQDPEPYPTGDGYADPYELPYPDEHDLPAASHGLSPVPEVPPSEVVPAARYAQPYLVPPAPRLPAAAGEPWTPVPVPPPLYLSAPAPRVRSVAARPQREHDDPGGGWPGDDPGLDGRRAVGGW